MTTALDIIKAVVSAVASVGPWVVLAVILAESYRKQKTNERLAERVEAWEKHDRERQGKQDLQVKVEEEKDLPLPPVARAVSVKVVESRNERLPKGTKWRTLSQASLALGLGPYGLGEIRQKAGKYHDLEKTYYIVFPKRIELVKAGVVLEFSETRSRNLCAPSRGGDARPPHAVGASRPPIHRPRPLRRTPRTKMKEVIAIVGPPLAGKSTLAVALASVHGYTIKDTSDRVYELLAAEWGITVEELRAMPKEIIRPDLVRVGNKALEDDPAAIAVAYMREGVDCIIGIRRRREWNAFIEAASARFGRKVKTIYIERPDGPSSKDNFELTREDVGPHVYVQMKEFGAGEAALARARFAQAWPVLSEITESGLKIEV